MKITTWILIAFVIFNAFAVMLDSTGVAADLGINSGRGHSGELDDVANQRKQIDTGSTQGFTLGSMWTTLGEQLAGLYGAVFPGIRMLNNVGVPAMWTSLMSTVVSSIMGIELIGFFRRG
jgi:hypothetical protein